MAPLAAVRHLLIDLDGTLLSHRDLPLAIDFITRVIRAFRPQVSWLHTLRALRALNQELHRPTPHGLQDLTNDRRAAEILARNLGVTPRDAEQILQRTIPVIFPSLKRHFSPKPDAQEFLAWARGVYGPSGLTLATNPVWPEELVLLRLEWANLDPSTFGAITHAGIMHACKPTEEYYRELLRIPHPLEARECLLIGNDRKMDLPATRIGIPVVLVSDSKALRRLAVPAGSAPAWQGSFPALRRALEQARGA